MRHPVNALALTSLLTLLAAPASALLSTGDPAMVFSKNRMVTGVVGPVLTSADFAGKVKITFVLGYN